MTEYRYEVFMIKHDGKIGAKYYFDQPYFKQSMREFIMDDLRLCPEWDHAIVKDVKNGRKVTLRYRRDYVTQ